MAQTITIQNFPKFNILQSAVLRADVAKGATSLSIMTEEQYDTTHAILLGSPGHPITEVALPSAIGDDVITVPAIDNAHLLGSQIFQLRGHKVKVYASPNVDGTQPINAATYTLVATKNIQADSLTTEVIHSAGGSGFWYIYTYYNDLPATPEETDKLLTEAVRGGNYGHYASISAIRREAGFDENDNVLDVWISDARDDAESQIKGSLSVAGYVLPLAHIPPIISNITKKIAAGNILLQDYGAGAEGTNKEGLAKIAYGERLLQKIIDREIILVDIEETVNENQTSSIDGFPNYTLDLDNPDEGFFFTRDQEF